MTNNNAIYLNTVDSQPRASLKQCPVNSSTLYTIVNKGCAPSPNPPRSLCCCCKRKY